MIEFSIFGLIFYFIYRRTNHSGLRQLDSYDVDYIYRTYLRKAEKHYRSELVSFDVVMISKLSKVKAILVNLFGGIVRTDLVAQAILNAYEDGMISVPIYARISGAESEKSKKMLSNSNAKLYDTVEEAISSLVQFMRMSK